VPALETKLTILLFKAFLLSILTRKPIVLVHMRRRYLFWSNELNFSKIGIFYVFVKAKFLRSIPDPPLLQNSLVVYSTELAAESEKFIPYNYFRMTDE
jgi:hypothetical protein